MINRIPDSTKRLLGNRKRSNKYLWLLVFFVAMWFPANFLYQYTFGLANGKSGSAIIQVKNSFSSWLNNVMGQSDFSSLNEQNQKLLQENATLKEQLRLNNIQFKSDEIQSTYTLKEFKVIGNDNFFDTPLLYLYGGSNNGIKSGLPALDTNGILVGTIDSVQTQLSVVKLTPNHNSRVGARITATEWNGILEGNRDLRAVLQMLPLESQVKNGDSVVTDNRNPDIPAGIILGTVSSVKDSDDHLFKEAILDLPYDSKKLDKVWVITGKK